MNGDGRRRDGKPFKDGNVDPSGSYLVGKCRTPQETRFAVGDGRKRGRRPKGARNYEKDWEEELNRTVKVIRNGKTVRVSAHRAQVMKTMEMGGKGKERSQETVYRQADRLADRQRKISTKNDDQLIAEWLAQQSAPAEGQSIVGDDRPPSSDPSLDTEDSSGSNHDQ